MESSAWRTITDPEVLRRALTQIRARGWADEVEELSAGVAAVAAPIRAYGGLVVGAIGVSGPVDRVCGPHEQPLPTLVTLVVEAARAVSRELGDLR